MNAWTTRALAVALLLQAQGCRDSNPVPVDGGSELDAGLTGCEVTFAGDFAENVSLAGACATLTTTNIDGGVIQTLHLHAFSNVTQAETTFDADLGSAPGPGTFNPGTLSRWSALAIIPGACTFSAGADAVPQGTFRLSLESIDSVHGTLHVEETVHAAPGSTCGTSSVELVDFRF